MHPGVEETHPSNGWEETPLQQILLSSLYLLDSMFAIIVWIDKLHKSVEKISFSV